MAKYLLARAVRGGVILHVDWKDQGYIKSFPPRESRRDHSCSRKPQIQSREALWIFNPPDYSETIDSSVTKQTVFSVSGLTSSSWLLGHSVFAHLCVYIYAYTATGVYTAERQQQNKKEQAERYSRSYRSCQIRYSSRLNRLSRRNPQGVWAISISALSSHDGLYFPGRIRVWRVLNNCELDNRYRLRSPRPQ